MKRSLLVCLLLIAVILAIASCSSSETAPEEIVPTVEPAPVSDPEPTAEPPEPTAEPPEPTAEPEEETETGATEDQLSTLKAEALETYANIAFASYEDAYTLTVALQTALEAFVADPNEETQQAAKDAWLAAREPYGQTEAYRFYGGPIDDADGPEGLINAWPLDEAYIDYVDGAPEAGIINNVAEFPEISKELIVSLNEVGAEENISAGYHAIEFLLWGQDFYEDGPGQRSFEDYVIDGDAPNAARRGQYLLAVGEQLVENLSQMKDAWDPSIDDNYRVEFLAMEADAAIRNVLTGIGVLSKSELSGERMFTALDNQDQEDEHSCFSDNTHRDIVNNHLGIVNVYTGQYTRTDGSVISGTSFADLAEAVAPEQNQQMLVFLEASTTRINALHTPFDQAIQLADERPKVLEAVFALQDQGDKIAEIASILGVRINTALPG